MKTVLIFGGYGFVGNFLYKYLINKHYKVYRYTSQKKNNKKSCIKYSEKSFIKLFKKLKPQYVFFLSGNSYPLFSKNDHLLDLKKNNIVLQDLFESAKK